MLLNKTTRIPGLKIIFKSVVDTTAIQRYYFLLGQVLFLTCHIIGKKG